MDKAVPVDIKPGGFIPPIDPESFGEWSNPTADLPGVVEWCGPLGTKIQFGERLTADGPSVFLSLSQPNEDPSITLWIDPVASQPMITIRTKNEGLMTYPLDKILRSPNAGRSGWPFV